MKINLIYAATSNGTMGLQRRGLPWNIKQELEFFKTTTIGDGNNAIVMGSVTFATLNKKPLKNRLNIVMSKDTNKKNVSDIFFCDTIEKVLWYCKENRIKELFVIGGNQIYELFLKEKIVDNIYYSHILEEYPGDQKMTSIDWRQYTLKSCKKTKEVNYYLYKRDDTDLEGELQYLNLMDSILKRSNYKKFGNNNMTFDLRDGKFPLLTTKRVFLKGIIEELLWFIRGDTDVTKLQKQGVNIWNANSTREYLDSRNLTHLQEWDVGPAYGFNFRSYGGEYSSCKESYIGKGGVDQIAYILNLLRDNPSSRRAIISLWNPMQLTDVALPACHVLYQFQIDDENQLSCSLFQRSGDMFLGVPFNIASASLLTNILALLLGCKTGYLFHTIGDAHIYHEHLDSVKEQLKRHIFPFPILKIKQKNQKTVEDFEYEDFIVEGYRYHPKLVSPMIT